MSSSGSVFYSGCGAYLGRLDSIRISLSLLLKNLRIRWPRVTALAVARTPRVRPVCIRVPCKTTYLSCVSQHDGSDQRQVEGPRFVGHCIGFEPDKIGTYMCAPMHSITKRDYPCTSRQAQIQTHGQEHI